MTKCWLSSQRMTIFVLIDSKRIIVQTAPIARTFIGQNIDNLIIWMRKQGGLKLAKIN